jgi:hypothetical protein
MALSEASGLALARKRNMSKIDFYHINYENLAINANPATRINIPSDRVSREIF